MSGMDLMSLARLVADEKCAYSFILDKIDPRCPLCGCKNAYVMSRMRLRCRVCRHDFMPLSATFLSRIKIPCSKWLTLIKLFELSTSARKAAGEVKVSYKTALKAFDLMRLAIISDLAKRDRALRGVIEADETYFGGRRKGKRGRGSTNKSIVFGILERKGRVHISIIKDVSADTLVNETVRKVKRGSIVYTDKWRSYDALVFCGYRHLSVDHQHKFKQGKVYINGIEGFWSYAKERLIKYHGVSKEKFLLYIKEMEWRYNNRNKDLYGLLLNYMLGVNYT